MIDERLSKGVERIKDLHNIHPYDLEVYLKALKILEKDEEVVELIKDEEGRSVGYIVQRGDEKILVFKDKIIC